MAIHVRTIDEWRRLAREALAPRRPGPRDGGGCPRCAELGAAVLALARERGPDAITTQAIADRIGVIDRGVLSFLGTLADLQRGLSDACSACSTYILGGDTNFGQSLILTGCAVGMFPGGRYLSRAGCREGDILYATGLLGAGNAFAASLLLANARSEFRPTARCKEGQALCGLATSCMDTSDGVLATLDQLMRVNNIGFELNGEWPEVLTPRAREISCNYGFPPWFMLAGHHGEFELLFTVPQEREDELMSRATEIAWEDSGAGRMPSVLMNRTARSNTVFSSTDRGSTTPIAAR